MFLISELHFMYSIVSGQGETGVQVLLKEWSIIFLDVLHEYLVYVSLELGTFSRDFLLFLGSILKETSSR